MSGFRKPGRAVIGWCVYAAAIAAILLLLFTVGSGADSFHRHLRQALNLAGLVTLILFIRFFYRAHMKGKIDIRLKERFGKIAKRIRAVVSQVVTKIFGGAFARRRSRIKGTDKRTLELFPNLLKRFRGRFGVKKKITIKDSLSGRRAIINLYIMFVLLRIRRGYAFKPAFTSREIMGDLGAREGEAAKPLFEQYEIARYAREFAISGEEIEECRKIGEGK